MNPLPDGITIRELRSLTELKASEHLQREVWGQDDPADNADLLLAIQYEGGLVAGAYREQRLVGFIFGFPAREPSIQHSHRLAVHPDCRGLGLGLALKAFQRRWCLKRGIELVRWTYDPALATNATLNIHRLGATSTTYYENYYGDMAGINAGVPSDRLLADWHLRSERVMQLAGDGEYPCSGLPDAEDGYVSIPPDFTRLIRDDLPLAREERLRIRQQLQQWFARGYRIVDFDRRTSRYRLAASGQPGRTT